MNKRSLFAIMRKDLKVCAENKGVMIPIIVIPIVLFVILPWVIMMGPSWFGNSSVNIQSLVTQINHLVSTMPAAIQNQLDGHTATEQMSIFVLVYALAPMFLVLPLMISSVLAADSFAGEKERKTVEALLYTPTTDRELFVAKLLGPWLAAILISLLSFVLYMAMVDLSGWIVMKEILFPNLMWIALILWVSPAVAGLSLIAMVFVSARAQGFQDAYQSGGLVVLPVLAMVAVQFTGVLFFTVWVVFILGLVFWILLAILLWLASKGFTREQLMQKK